MSATLNTVDNVTPLLTSAMTVTYPLNQDIKIKQYALDVQITVQYVKNKAMIVMENVYNAKITLTSRKIHIAKLFKYGFISQLYSLILYMQLY